MRISQQPLAPGEKVDLSNGSSVERGNARPNDVRIVVGPQGLSATDIGNINAAIKPTGYEVGSYWRAKKAGLTPLTGSITLFNPSTGAQRLALVPNTTVMTGVGQRVPGSPVGTLNAPTAPTAPVQSAPVVVAPVPAPVAGPFQPAQTPSTVLSAAIRAAAPLPTLTEVDTAEVETIDLSDEEDETVSEDDQQNSHRYRPNPDMLDLWDASERALAAGFLPDTLFFAGPAGSGKTDGAAFLAARSGIDYTKVDAASMTDPESWFGTREVIADPATGSSVTVYHPSDMVLAVQRPGLVYIDEVTRKSDAHRNVWLPMIDGTRRVTNPLTGQVIQVHRECRIIMGGNIGLNFSGTYAVDIAFLTRVGMVTFDYLAEADEAEVLQEATGCDERTAKALARFGADVRSLVNTMVKAGDTDLNKVATRQLISAAKSIRFGADIDRVAHAYFFQMVSDEGGAGSLRQKLLSRWTGIRPLFDAPADGAQESEADGIN